MDLLSNVSSFCNETTVIPSHVLGLSKDGDVLYLFIKMRYLLPKGFFYFPEDNRGKTRQIHRATLERTKYLPW